MVKKSHHRDPATYTYILVRSCKWQIMCPKNGYQLVRSSGYHQLVHLLNVHIMNF